MKREKTAMFSRRAVLRQLASIPITLPLARTLYAQMNPATAGAKKNLVLFQCNNGTKRGNFWPTGTGSVYPVTNTPVLNSLFTSDGKAADNGLKAKTNLFRGLTVFPKGSSGGNAHDNGGAQMFTGVPLVPGAGGAPYGGAKSVDQVLADKWGVRTYTTGVYASQVQNGPKPGFNHRISFSYDGPAMTHTPFINPLEGYTGMIAPFAAMAGGNSAANAAALAQMLMKKKSILDAVSGDLSDLQMRLGPDDANKLDSHLSSIRDAEKQLQMAMSGGGNCSAMAPMDYAALGGTATSPSEAHVPDMVNAHMSLMAAALKCGLTRIASLQFGYIGGKWAFGWLGINLNHHDSIAHRDGSDTGTDQVSNWVTQINQWYASNIQKFAVDLASAPDPSGHGTVLDNTLIIWTNELGRGDHQLSDIPVVFIGLVGNGISAGGRVLDVRGAGGGAQQTHNIFVFHALKALDIPCTGWGDTPTLSVIPGF
jgi:hypothetical protein